MKNVLINSHVHSTASDGKLAPEEMTKEAIAAGISYICFCDHYKRPEAFRKSKEFDYESYVKKIKELAEKYKSEIEIAFGTEIDWLEQYKEWIINEVKNNKKRYDLIIGSIHYLSIQNEYFPIDNTPELWKKVAEKIGVKDFVKEYYNQLRLMIESKLFDCIGHFDLIKIYNKDSRFFNENEDWYKKEVLETLDMAEVNKISMEINTHGFKKEVSIQYPSEWILKEANKRKIPITISSDAHRTGEIADKLAEAVQLARKAGYQSIIKFKNHKMIEIKI